MSRDKVAGRCNMESLAVWPSDESMKCDVCYEESGAWRSYRRLYYYYVNTYCITLEPRAPISYKRGRAALRGLVLAWPEARC